MPGAAILVARAAQRAGAGLVIMGRSEEELRLPLALGAPECVQFDATMGVPWSARSPHARLVGPGLLAGADTHRRVLQALDLDDGAPLVLDGGALGGFEAGVDTYQEGRCERVLTPHPGEAARLLERPVGGSDEEREAVALELASRSGGVVCLKGANTLVASPTGELWRATAGNPGMATAGSGDVLAGILVAYLASARAAGWSLSSFQLATLAVHVHGRAGDLAEAVVGERALVASDLIEYLPAAQIELAQGESKP